MLNLVEMPSLSPTMKTGKVVNWVKNEGDKVAKGDIIFEVETDKANVEVESYAGGFLRKILVAAGVEVPVNTVIAVIADSMDEDISSVAKGAPAPGAPPAEEKAAAKAAPAAEAAQPAAPAPTGERIRISPLARKMAQEHGLDISRIAGSGPEGRIVKADIEKALAEGVAPAPAEAPVTAPAGPAYQDIPLTKMRKVIAQRLGESKRTAPHFYIDMAADATALSAMRQEMVKKQEQLGVKVTFNDIIIKLVAHALTEFPLVNASYQDEYIRSYKIVNIGVAVGIDDGLVVPVLNNADKKSISQISKEVRVLAKKAKDKKLLPQDYAGGTFTITNLGMFGVETFHAIINPPEAGILAVSSVIEKPVVVDGQVQVRPCMTISLSVDHRVVDGVLAAQFLGRVRELIESPYLLFA